MTMSFDTSHLCVVTSRRPTMVRLGAHVGSGGNQNGEKNGMPRTLYVPLIARHLLPHGVSRSTQYPAPTSPRFGSRLMLMSQSLVALRNSSVLLNPNASAAVVSTKSSSASEEETFRPRTRDACAATIVLSLSRIVELAPHRVSSGISRALTSRTCPSVCGGPPSPSSFMRPAKSGMRDSHDLIAAVPLPISATSHRSSRVSSNAAMNCVRVPLGPSACSRHARLARSGQSYPHIM